MYPLYIYGIFYFFKSYYTLHYNIKKININNNYRIFLQLFEEKTKKYINFFIDFIVISKNKEQIREINYSYLRKLGNEYKISSYIKKFAL